MELTDIGKVRCQCNLVSPGVDLKVDLNMISACLFSVRLANVHPC